MDTLLQIDFWKRVLDEALNWLLRSGPTLVVILVGAFVLIKLTKTLIKRLAQMLQKRADRHDSQQSMEHQKRIQTLMGIVSNAIKVSIWALVTLLVLRELGVDIAPILAGAGVIGLAVGFGAQNLVKDVISGFFMLVENQIRVGDVAVINGTGGLVENINLRTTILRDLSGVVHIFPNGSINQVSNMTKDWSAMVFEVGVAYKEDVDDVMNVMETVSGELLKDGVFGPKMLEAIEIFGVDKFGDNAVVIKARIKTQPIMQWEVGREYNRRLKKAFDAAGIEIPFPQRTLHVGSTQVEGALLAAFKQAKATDAA